LTKDGDLYVSGFGNTGLKKMKTQKKEREKKERKKKKHVC